MPALDVHGARLAYDTGGDPSHPAVVFIHAGVATRAMWDPQFDAEEQKKLQELRATQLHTLEEQDRDRVVTLIARQQEINALAAQNPSFTGELLRSELTKTDRLVEAFIEMATTCSRYEAYLDSINLSELERERRRYEAIVNDQDIHDSRNDIAGKNLANTKTELVIFIRPVVIDDPSLDGDYRGYRTLLPGDDFMREPHPARARTSLRSEAAR